MPHFVINDKTGLRFEPPRLPMNHVCVFCGGRLPLGIKVKGWLDIRELEDGEEDRFDTWKPGDAPLKTKERTFAHHACSSSSLAKA